MPDGVKFSQFTQAVPDSSDKLVGLHGNTNAKFSFADIISAIRQGLANIFVPKTDVGAAGGVASLDSNGKVLGNQLDLSSKQSTITANGILKGNGAGGVSAAVAGTDYQTPLVAGTDYATPAMIPDPTKAGSISLSGTWSGSGPYTQTVTVTGATVTASSKVDIQLTAAQIATLITAGVTAMVIENNNGTLTAYAVGVAPSAMTVQVTVTEVST